MIGNTIREMVVNSMLFEGSSFVSSISQFGRRRMVRMTVFTVSSDAEFILSSARMHMFVSGAGNFIALS